VYPSICIHSDGRISWSIFVKIVGGLHFTVPSPILPQSPHFRPGDPENSNINIAVSALTHTQPFYGSVEFVRDNPGEPVPFTHSTLIVVINHPNPLSPSTTNHGILRIQSTCSAVFFHNLSPSFLWSTSWRGTLHFILHTFLHPIIIFFSQHMPIPSQPVPL